MCTDFYFIQNYFIHDVQKRWVENRGVTPK